MSMWALSVLALLPAFALPVFVACRDAHTGNRLVAAELASSLACCLLAALTFVIDQSSFMDIALCLALLSLPGALIIATFLERWL